MVGKFMTESINFLDSQLVALHWSSHLAFSETTNMDISSKIELLLFNQKTKCTCAASAVLWSLQGINQQSNLLACCGHARKA